MDDEVDFLSEIKPNSFCSPDNWVVIKISTDTGGTVYKVLAGWSGGYMNGSSWQLNSGIVKVDEDTDNFFFHGASGSIYKCRKDSYCLRMNSATAWNMLKGKYPDSVELMDEDTNWSTLQYK